MPTPDYITLSIAVIGATTGVIGTGLAVWSLYRQIDQDRVKLRIGASWALATHSPRTPSLAISVTNISKFPVTVRDVGVLFDRDSQRAGHANIRTSDGRQLPIRMEPRTAVSVFFPPEFLNDPRLITARCAYAITDCGESVESAPGVIPKMIAAAQCE